MTLRTLYHSILVPAFWFAMLILLYVVTEP